MGIFKHPFFTTPWKRIRFFVPFTAAVPFAVYYATTCRHVYPGLSAFLTASAAGLCPQEDLSHPLFTWVTRSIASLPYLTLPLRLNFFCAACGALTAALFYLLTARLVFIFACEDPGGAMAALPPRIRNSDADDDDASAGENLDFATNPDGTPSIPVSVQMHNRRVSFAAVLGGLGATLVLAFNVPFWMASTRFYPFTFDLLLCFLIINLMISYDQRSRLITLFPAAFLLATCSVESSLFLILLPIGSAFLIRSMILNDQATTSKVLWVVLSGLIGLVAAVLLVWKIAASCAAVTVLAPRPVFHVFLTTAIHEMAGWVPSFGWSYIAVQLLFPAAISLFVFAYSFRRRTPIFFIAQLALIIPLIPSLLNLDIAPWGIARNTFKLPVFSYAVIALLTGLTVAVWYLMCEMFEEKIDEDLDYYEYRDNPIICRIGAVLCWPLLLLTCAVPFRSLTDIQRLDGRFADAVTEEIYRELGPRDWLINSEIVSHQLMIRAYRDGRRLHFLSTRFTPGPYTMTQLGACIRATPSFAPYRNRLLNAADLSPTAFLGEWLKHETNAYQRIVLFNEPSIWRANGFQAVPTGFFISGIPSGDTVNATTLLTKQETFVKQMTPWVTASPEIRMRLFSVIREAFRRQLALMANELGCLLFQKNKKDEAAALFHRSEVLDPDNLCLVLNRYELAHNRNVDARSAPEIEGRLRQFQQQINTFTITAAALQSEQGTLLDPDILEFVRRNIWGKTHLFLNLSTGGKTIRTDPLTAVRDRKRELYQTITKLIDASELDDAECQLNLLLDMDDKDRFALINKARVAIERKDLPEAGLWMDLAKENGVPPSDLVWHNASLLINAGKIKQARILLNEAMPSHLGDIRLWGLLADILLRTGDYPELENRVYPAMRNAASKKEHYLMYMVRGYILKHNGPADYPTARAAFLRALALNRHLDAVREEILHLDDALGVPAFCEEDAKEVLRSDPEHAFANFLWGSVRLHRHEFDLAEDLFVRSLEKERNAPAYAGMGAVLLERGEYANAEKFLKRSLSMDNTRLSTYHTLARLLMATGRLDDASHALDTVRAKLPDDFDVRMTYIQLLIKQSKLEEAALRVSELLENEELLPPEIQSQVKAFAAQLSAALRK